MALNTGGINNYASSGLFKTLGAINRNASQAINQPGKSIDNTPAATYTPSNQETSPDYKFYNAFGRLVNGSANVVGQNEQLSAGKNVTAHSGDTAFQRVDNPENDDNKLQTSLPYLTNPITRPPVTRIPYHPYHEVRRGGDYHINPVVLNESTSVGSIKDTETQVSSDLQRISDANGLRANDTSLSSANIKATEETQALSNSQETFKIIKG